MSLHLLLSVAASVALPTGIIAWKAGLESGLAQGQSGARDEAFAQGRDEGFADGFAEGRAEGLRSGESFGIASGYRDGHADGKRIGRAEVLMALQAQTDIPMCPEGDVA